MIYGYHRTSTTDQHLDRGITEIEAHWVDGCQKQIENWRTYRVTKAAFEKLKAQYPISMECLLD